MERQNRRGSLTPQQKQKEDQEYQREAFLLDLLTPEARQRLLTLKTINPEGAEDIESTLIRAFRSEMVKDRITESDLLNLIERDKEARAQQKEFLKSYQNEKNK